MSKFKDITGQKFGRLTVIKRVESNRGKSFWLCRCDCGQEKAISLSNLQRGITKSCGCLYLENIKYGDITNRKFGRLTAIENKKNNHWLFKCECGITKTVNKYNVITGKVVSCGCRQKENYKSTMKDIAGQRFGSIIAVKRTEKKTKGGNSIWECLCDCGKKFTAPVSEIIRNHHLSCGCKLTFRGEGHFAWKGGKFTTFENYVYVKASEHPFATKEGYVFEHRLSMEKTIGRYLLPNENVHHRNGIRHDNRPENLELWTVPQPSGQRAEDLVKFAREILEIYGELY